MPFRCFENSGNTCAATSNKFVGAKFYFTKGILKMKKFISLVSAATLAISSITCASAADEGIKVYLERSKINFDVQPQTINDRTMVPIRAIFEAMGANVTWDDATQTATSTKDDTTVKMTLNSTTEYINDTAHTMDVSRRKVIRTPILRGEFPLLLR